MIRILAALCFCFLLACSAEDAPPEPMAWPDLTERPLPEPTRTVRFGPGGTDLADLWLPEGEGPHPVVLMIHGGCWQKDIADRTLMNYAAEALRAQGLAVWNAEYRGVDEEGGGYPGTFSDIARSAEALAERGPGLGLSTGRVVAYGHSAGGHLALWLAAARQLPAFPAASRLDLDGVVSTGGLADLAEAEPVTLPSCLADVRERLTGTASSERPDPYADTSPDRLLPLGVAQVSIHAENDRIAPPALGESWTQEARAAGDAAQLVRVPGGHVELIAPGTPAWGETVRVLKDMLGEDAS
ncbi:alpha/beta hydrolase family protein [Parvularcula oceani]|uniref:alpha/beta hydrolase family protein n=1 Tax=Parvularcula oceani TaxID=1247963 RepID=UPI00068ECB4C|nr:alpha/beta hydrolase [Parvularcula oceani]